MLSLINYIFHQISKIPLAWYFGLLYKFDIKYNTECVSGPKIFIANHPTTVDPFVLYTLLRIRVYIMLHGVIFHIPVFGWIIRYLGHIPVFAGNSKESMRKAHDLLKAGKSVLIFPEGRKSYKTGRMHRGHTGAVRLSLITGCPMIPIGLAVNPQTTKYYKIILSKRPLCFSYYYSGRYAITFGESIYLKGNVNNRKFVKRITDSLMKKIHKLRIESNSRINKSGLKPGFNIPSKLLMRLMR